MAIVDMQSVDLTFYTENEAVSITKLNTQINNLKAYFKERDDIIELMFYCILAKQHCVMIGPPGTAKSYLIESVIRGIKNFTLFQWQMTKFSTPEELFGPYSLLALKAGKYERITSDKLPQANIGYLDEIFNANSSILNALNSCMNERTFEGHPLELDAIFSATNFTPEETVLVAFYDRFLFRCIVNEIAEANAFESMLGGGDFTVDPSLIISKKEIKELQLKLKAIACDGIIPLMTRLREELKNEGIFPSSRRFRWALESLKARALLEGRKEVTDEDMFVLKNVLWTDKKDIPVVERIIAQVVNPALAQVKELLQQAKDIESQVKMADPKNPNDLAKIMESLEKLKAIHTDITEFIRKKRLSPKVEEIAQKIMDQVQETGRKIQNDKLKFTF